MSTPLKAMKTPKGIFNVPPYYEFKKTLGYGAYGIVIECLDTRTGERVAIKKISDVFTREKSFQTQVYREIKILKHFSKHPHENIVKMKDLVTAPSFTDFKDVYIIMETLAQGDLRNYIRRGTEFTDKDIQFYLYHILKGLKFVHTAGIMHRDVKPSNVLLKTLKKESSAVKICDFGLSKGFNKENPVHTPSYVATRSYRAPEFLLMYDKSSTAADIWAAGTILAEMLQPVDKRKQSPFLQGKDYLDQLNLIVNLCGTPPLPYTKAAPSAQQYLENLPKHTRKNFKALFPSSVNPLAIDLLDKMLVFDADERITVDDALQHPYFDTIRSSDSHPNSSCKYTFEDIQLPNEEDQMQIDEGESSTIEFANTKSLKRLIYEELMDWQGISS